MAYRTPLARTAGLGSAKEGTHHWWLQRITAIALVPLSIWLTVSIVRLIGADFETVRAWIAQPLVAILMLLLLFAGFYHMKLGLQVIIEDYVHDRAVKLTLNLLVLFAAIGLSVAAGFSVLKIAFGG